MRFFTWRPDPQSGQSWGQINMGQLVEGWYFSEYWEKTWVELNQPSWCIPISNTYTTVGECSNGQHNHKPSPNSPSLWVVWLPFPNGWFIIVLPTLIILKKMIGPVRSPHLPIATAVGRQLFPYDRSHQLLIPVSKRNAYRALLSF